MMWEGWPFPFLPLRLLGSYSYFKDQLVIMIVPLADSGATRVRTLAYSLHPQGIPQCCPQRTPQKYEGGGRKERLNLGEFRIRGILVPVGLLRHKAATQSQPPRGPSSSLGGCPGLNSHLSLSPAGGFPAGSFQRHRSLPFSSLPEPSLSLTLLRKAGKVSDFKQLSLALCPAKIPGSGEGEGLTHVSDV